MTNVIAILNLGNGYVFRAEAHLTDDTLSVHIYDVNGERARQELPITSAKASSLIAAASIIGSLTQRDQRYAEDTESDIAYRIVSLARAIDTEGKRK